MHIGRRRLLVGAGAASLALLAVRGLPSLAPGTGDRVRRIGWLGAGGGPGTAPLLAAFRQGLSELGQVEGRTYVFEERRGSGDDDLDEPAAELASAQPEVILVGSSTTARAMRGATSTIPIVNAGPGDLVRQGLAASYARPGGNVTGLSSPALVGKQLQLLQEALPGLKRAAVIRDGTIPSFDRAPYDAAAGTLGLELHFESVRGPGDLEPVVEAVLRARVGGAFVPSGPAIRSNQTQLAGLVAGARIASLWQQLDAVAQGGLMAYGPNPAEMYRRAAAYVDKILKGAAPGEIPIEQPTKFDLTLNLTTAAALGLTIPETVLQQATEVVR